MKKLNSLKRLTSFSFRKPYQDFTSLFMMSFGVLMLGLTVFNWIKPILSTATSTSVPSANSPESMPAPGGVTTNLQLWLKAETGTNTTTDGQNINAWADQSANAYSANADTGATDFPTYTSDAINFNPGINFDGNYTDDYSDGLHLDSNYIYSANSGMHIFVVCDPNIDGESDNYLFDFGLQSNGGYGMIYSNTDYGLYTNSTAGGINTELTHAYGDAPALVEMEVDFDDSHSFYRNGTSLTSIPITLSQLTATEVTEADVYGSGSPSYTSGPVSIGRKSASVYLPNDGGRIFYGHISEVMVYNDLMTQSDKEMINSYLAIKYGLTVNHHYYSCVGDTLKKIDDGYANNITGIGRDDGIGLNQKQSKSVGSEAFITIGRQSIAATNAANANTFTQDTSYLTIADNGVALNSSWTTVAPLSEFQRLDRLWKINQLNYNEMTRIRIDLDDPDFDLPPMPANGTGDYYLIFDTDDDLTNGGNSYSQISTPAGPSLLEGLFSLNTYNYFTVGIRLTEDCNNLVDDDNDGNIDCDDSDCDCCDATAPGISKK